MRRTAAHANLHASDTRAPLTSGLAHTPDIYDLIRNGAKSFLHAEYKICALFVVVFGAVIYFLVSVGSGSQAGLLTTIAFVLGAITSMVAGYLGMMIAVFSNARCVELCRVGADKPEPTPSCVCANASFRIDERSTIAKPPEFFVGYSRA